VKLFGVRLYAICSSDGPSAENRPAIYFTSIEFLNTGLPKKDGKDYVFMAKQHINPQLYGAREFKSGDISFYPGSVKKALVVDNNFNDPSLYDLTLKKVAYGF
jgi:hypothetical protein